MAVGVRRAQRVKVTRSRGCAVLHDGTVSCWGSNYSGALGRGETTSEVALGPETTCVITHALEVYCFGMLGRRKQPTPVKMRLDD